MVTAYWCSKQHRGYGLIEKACNERQHLFRVLIQPKVSAATASHRPFDGRGMGRARVRAKGNDYECMGTPFIGDKDGPCRIAVRADISVGQIRSIEHHVGRIAYRDTLLFVDGHNVLSRQHIVDARSPRRLEGAPGEGVGYETLDFFAGLSLGPQLSYLQDARQVRSRAFAIHALWLLAGGQGVLDDGGEPVFAVPHFDVAGSAKNIDRRIARHRRRASAESESDLFLLFHKQRLLALGLP